MSPDFEERRAKPRFHLTQMVRIRPSDAQFPPEYCNTFNVSASGIYFVTSAGHYTLGMTVYVTSDFRPGSPLARNVSGAVVRIDPLPDGQLGIAVQLLP